MTGEWRKLHNEEHNDLYCSPITIQVIKLRKMRWVGKVACMGVRRSAYWVLAGKPDGRLFGRPRQRWEDNINMDFQEVRCGGMDWIELT